MSAHATGLARPEIRGGGLDVPRLSPSPASGPARRPDYSAIGTRSLAALDRVHRQVLAVLDPTHAEAPTAIACRLSGEGPDNHGG